LQTQVLNGANAAQLLRRHFIKESWFRWLNSLKTAFVQQSTDGKKLMDVVDVFLNNGSVYGDATVEVPDGKKICSASTACFAIFAQVINFAVAKEMLSRGITPPVLISANVDQGDSSNASLKREKAPPAV
jgi:uncharacterized phosphosugar-binding protein